MPKVTEEHRQQRREQIITAAMGCVARDGFHKTTMADVIRASELSAGAVYGYFRSKDDLILAIADRALGYFDTVIADLLAADPVPSPAQVTEHLATLVTGMSEQNGPDLSRVAVSAWAEAIRSERVQAAVAERFRAVRKAYARVIVRQQEAGHIDAAADPEVVAKTLFGLMPGFVLQRLITGDLTPQDYAAGVAALHP